MAASTSNKKIYSFSDLPPSNTGTQLSPSDRQRLEGLCDESERLSALARKAAAQHQEVLDRHATDGVKRHNRGVDYKARISEIERERNGREKTIGTAAGVGIFALCVVLGGSAGMSMGGRTVIGAGVGALIGGTARHLFTR